MGELIRIIFGVFALYRTASLLSSEEGPYLPFLYKDEDQTGIFKILRHKLGGDDLAYDEKGNLKPRTNLGRGIICPLCTAAYLAIPIIFLLQFPTIPGNLFLAYFGIWGIQTFLENLTSTDQVSEAIEDVAENMEK